MGLIPERTATKIKQSFLLVLAAVFEWIGALVGFMNANMSWQERLLFLVSITILIVSVTWGLLVWAWS
jgi:hypothetical protein